MKHCNIHNQDYMDHVTSCPICRGEKMKKIPTREQADLKIIKFKRKVIQIDADELNSDWVKNSNNSKD